MEPDLLYSQYFKLHLSKIVMVVLAVTQNLKKVVKQTHT